MSQFCTSCGTQIIEGAGFCTACGARQPGPVPAASPVPARSGAASAAPGTPAPTKGSPAIKFIAVALGIIALITVAAFGSCVFLAYRIKHKAEHYTAAMKTTFPETATRSTMANGMPYLPETMDKLGAAILKPTSSFHLSFKKASSDGTSYSLEEDVTPSSLTGEETQVTPKTRMGNMDVGGTQVFPRNATAGTHDWQMTVSAIEMAYLNGMDIRDAQPGMKYIGEEEAGGYAARRYDFDLANVPASEKAGTLLGAKWLGAVVNNTTGQKGATLQDFNIKGSAWIAKDDGRIVKFQYDNISMFSDGSQNILHREGMVTRK